MDELTPKENMYINIIITEILCMLVILVSVLVLKYFFKGEYKEFKAWYNTEITADTKIEEVIG